MTEMRVIQLLARLIKLAMTPLQSLQKLHTSAVNSQLYDMQYRDHTLQVQDHLFYSMCVTLQVILKLVSSLYRS